MKNITIGVMRRDPDTLEVAEREQQLAKCRELRKMYNDAGVNIHIHKMGFGQSDEEIEFSFLVAKALGCTIKLLAICERITTPAQGKGTAQQRVSARVYPALVPLSHPLATVNGAFNAVVVEAEEQRADQRQGLRLARLQ